MDLSVVIPVYDESGNLEPLIAEIEQALTGRAVSWEIVIVDDGSRDATVEELDALRRSKARTRVIRHDRNLGQSSAILSGVRAARAPWIVTLDGDGQNDPADIPALLACSDAACGTPGLIAGVRRRREDTALRRLSSRIANLVRARLLRDDCPDTGCGLKLFRRDVFLSLPHFDHMHRFLPALFRRAGADVALVAVNHRPRVRGWSKYGVSNRLWAGIVDMAGMMWLQRRSLSVEVLEREHEQY